MRITILRNTVLGLLCLGTLLGQAIPAEAVPKGTSTKKYCGCTCATNAGNGFLYWERSANVASPMARPANGRTRQGGQGPGRYTVVSTAPEMKAAGSLVETKVWRRCRAAGLVCLSSRLCREASKARRR